MNDGTAINEWKCSTCGVHIGDDMALMRVSYAVDRAGFRNLLRDPDLLVGDEYCSPRCAITGSINMLYRLKREELVLETFGAEDDSKRYADDDPDIYAYMSGLGIVSGGDTPIVVVERDLAALDEIGVAMKVQAQQTGTEVRLVHYVPVEVVRAFGG